MTLAMARILFLEDSDLDAAILRDRVSGFARPIQMDRATDRAGFVSALAGTPYDVILSDYQVPGFEGLDALALARQHQPDVPFLFVSGVMGEEVAQYQGAYKVTQGLLQRFSERRVMSTVMASGAWLVWV